MNPLRYKVLMLVLGIFLCDTMQAQVGLRFGYDWVTHNVWRDAITSSNLGMETEISSNLGLGIDYGFRLKSVRIEFFPTFYYSKSNFIHISGVGYHANYDYQQYLFKLNTHFYFLDFFGDCDCPTWSNDNEFTKKGLFLHLGPEVGIRNHDVLGFSNADEFFGFGGGIGLDIGVFKWLTFSPMIRMGYRSSTEWDNLSADESISDDTIYYGAEIRLGFRFNSN